MAEGTEQVEETAGNAAEGVKDRAQNAMSNGGGLGKVIVPGALAATAAAVAYAASKGAPKLKDSLSSKAADEAQDVAEGAVDKAKDKGGIAGFAAKMLDRGGDGDGGGGGMLGGIAEKVVPGMGGKDKEPSEGWGKGRRNPIQLVADVGVPVREAYNQWTMLEEFPKFMHRVTSVQVDDDDRSKVKWAEKIWFSKRQWEAEITEMIPDKRIAWRSVSGTKHTGHVTFHPLEDNLTRVIVNLDFNPSGMLEKMASGMRFVKRAAKSDVYRFKAFIETHEQATGAWRGRIEDGEVVKDAEVQEGKPFEEGQEQRRPEGSGKQKDVKGRQSDDDARDESDEEREEEQDSRDQDELRAQREERQKRREERRQEAGSRS
jgi:uncharacterized membrane protein